MNLSSVDKAVIQCMNDIGIIVDEEDLRCTDVNLLDYDIDSIMFISLLVNIEEKLGISIPDEYLAYEILSSYRGFVTIIKELVANNNET